ncbi:unnamed protein product [Coccothraustes coccothraustes]
MGTALRRKPEQRCSDMTGLKVTATSALGTAAARAARTHEQEWHGGTPHVAPAAAVPWSRRDNRGCPCLPCLPAGVLRAPTLSRSCGRGTPAHTEESGLASRADGEPGGGLPPPCAHTRYPASSPPFPRRIGGRGNPGAHASEPGAAPRPPPGAPHSSPGQTPVLRSAPPAAGPTPGGERHCSGGAGGTAAGGQQAGGRCQR